MMTDKDLAECLCDVIAGIAYDDSGLDDVIKSGLSAAVLPSPYREFMSAAIARADAGLPVVGHADELITEAAKMSPGLSPEAIAGTLRQARELHITATATLPSARMLADELKQKTDNEIETALSLGIDLSPDLVFTDSDSSAWRPLEPLDDDDRKTVQPFPVEAMPAEIGDMVRAVSLQLQTPEPMCATLALGVLAAGIGGSYDVELNRDWTEALCLWVLVSAESGEKKSPSFKKMTAPLKELERELQDEAQDDIQADKLKHKRNESRLKKLEAKDSKAGLSPEEEREYSYLFAEVEKHIPVTEPDLLCDDSTPAALVESLRRNRGCITMMAPEPGIFSRLANRRSGDDSGVEMLLGLNSGDDIFQDRIGRGRIYIRSPRMSCIIGTQPDILSAAMSDRELMARGFFARWMYADVSRYSRFGYRNQRPPEIPVEVAAGYNRLIKSLYERPPEQGTERKRIRLSPEAAAIFERYCAENEIELRPGGSLSGMRAWANKLNGNTARIAGLLHAAAIGPGFGDAPISGITMDFAISIARWFCGQAAAVFRSCGDESPELYLLKFLRKHGKDITFRDLQSKTRYKARRKEQVAEVLEALHELRQRGYVRLVRQQTGGRPSYIVSLNPEAYNHR